jgi:UDP-N-acetyl-D-galactosamine dehydrogenase
MTKIFPCIIGLGYVGLPLFVRLKKKFQTIGYDTDFNRIKYLKKKIDKNDEYKKKDLNLINNSILTNKSFLLKKSNFFIITVPTPVKKNFMPDLTHIKSASKVAGKNLKKNDIVFVESTIYPSVTQKICLKIIEKFSGFKNNKDFNIGYSSERINPGDKIHSVENIKKVVAIETNKKEVLKRVLLVYKSVAKKLIISKHIKEAETSKVIENIQRDLNIALMNEIYLICERLEINFHEVKRLALSKWNFHNYSPGLVGGHCLPVDPYYLAHIAKQKNYPSEVILSGRKINNGMEKYIINKIIKITKIKTQNKKVLLFGITYKSDVADIRNSIPYSIWKKLRIKYKKKIDCVDSCVDKEVAKKNNISTNVTKEKYDYFIPLVKHKDFDSQFKKAKMNNKEIKLIDLWV